jgi:hypothetical protein
VVSGRGDGRGLTIKQLAEEALAKLSPVFDAMYSSVGRPSIPPERLLKATLLMAFYTVRSERLFCEQLGYNLLFRWFLDMDVTVRPWISAPAPRNRRSSPTLKLGVRDASSVVRA